MQPKYGKPITEEALIARNNGIVRISNEPATQIVSKLQSASNVLGKIFGGKQIGEPIGTLAGLGVSKIKNTDKFYDISAPSPLEVVGDIAGAGLSVAGFKGVGVTGDFTSRILKMAGLGAGIGASQAISEGAEIKDVATGAATSGVFGASIPVAGVGLRAIGRQIENLPSRFINSALSRSKAEVLRDIAKDKVDDFAKYVLKSKPIGTATKLLSQSADNIELLGNKISTILSLSTRQTGEKTTIGINNFLDDIVKIPEAQGALLKRVDIKNIVERLAPQTKQLLQKKSLTITESNKLRQLVDKTLGDRAFLGAQLSSDKIILKKFADSLREMVKIKAPEGTRILFTELSNEIRFRDSLLNKIAQRQGNQVLSFGDFIGGGLGGIFGGGLPGAVAGVTARRVIESVPFKITAAKMTNALTKLAPTIEQLSPAQQTAILNFFAEIFSNSREQVPQEE